MATQEGLEDQMLGITVAREEAELETRRVQLVLEDAENKRVQKEIEDTILDLLKNSEGNILDDEVILMQKILRRKQIYPQCRCHQKFIKTTSNHRMLPWDVIRGAPSNSTNYTPNVSQQVLISTLAQSKVTSNIIERKVKEAAKTQEVIAKTRTGYIPIAFRASQLFFCIADLGTVDPMYQVISDKLGRNWVMAQQI